MSTSERPALNRAMGIEIGNLLRGGVIIAAAVVFLGGIIYLFRYGSAPADYKVFHRVPPDLCSVPGIMKNAFQAHGRGLIQLGLLLLILTPIARVVLSMVVFVRQRDGVYVLVTAFVFVVLIYSLFGR